MASTILTGDLLWIPWRFRMSIYSFNVNVLLIFLCKTKEMASFLILLFYIPISQSGPELSCPSHKSDRKILLVFQDESIYMRIPVIKQKSLNLTILDIWICLKHVLLVYNSNSHQLVSKQSNNKKEGIKAFPWIYGVQRL